MVCLLHNIFISVFVYSEKILLEKNDPWEMIRTRVSIGEKVIFRRVDNRMQRHIQVADQENLKIAFKHTFL